MRLRLGERTTRWGLTDLATRREAAKGRRAAIDRVAENRSGFLADAARAALAARRDRAPAGG